MEGTVHSVINMEVEMLPKSLNLVEAKRPVKDTPVNNRRSRLLRQIDAQIALTEQPASQTLPDRRCWYWLDTDGKYLLAIKYGRKAIELAKGKFAIKCPSVPDVKASLAKVRESVATGEFDAVLATMASEIRSKFKNKAA